MKKPGKKTIISLIIIAALLVFYLALSSYRKPIAVQKTFENSIMRKVGSKETFKEINIELNANLIRGVYEGALIHFDGHFKNRLEGNVIIDNKQYYLEGNTNGSQIASIIGAVYDNKQRDTIMFLLKMDDLNSIMLIDDDYYITGKAKQ